MPWNNQSGGNTPGPWGRGPSNGNGGSDGGGNRPPDFEEMWRRLQFRLRNLMPSEGWTIGTIALAAVVLIGLWLLSGLYFVSTHEQGVVRRFGRFLGMPASSPNYHLALSVE